MINCVVTGASGYIGSRLVCKLLTKNFKVFAIVRPESSLSMLPIKSENLIFYKYDNTFQSIADLFVNNKINTVFHLASCSDHHHSSLEIKKLIDSNILFGSYLIEAMTSAGCKKLINTGSYWQQGELEHYSPVCFYAATKQCIENIIDYYISIKSLQAITLRLTDVYGLSDPRGKLLCLLKKAMATGKELELTPGEQYINLVHVDDVCSAYLDAYEDLNRSKLNTHQIFYVAAKKMITVKQLADKFSAIYNKPLKVKWGGIPYREKEIMKPYIGKFLPGWESEVSLEEGLRQIIQNLE